jgi:hypothetical protein
VIDTNTDSAWRPHHVSRSPAAAAQYIVVDSANHRAYVSLFWGHEEKGMYGEFAIINTVDNSIIGLRARGHSARPHGAGRGSKSSLRHRSPGRPHSGGRYGPRNGAGQVPVGSDPVGIALVPARER